MMPVKPTRWIGKPENKKAAACRNISLERLVFEYVITQKKKGKNDPSPSFIFINYIYKVHLCNLIFDNHFPFTSLYYIDFYFTVLKLSCCCSLSCFAINQHQPSEDKWLNCSLFLWFPDWGVRQCEHRSDTVTLPTQTSTAVGPDWCRYSDSDEEAWWTKAWMLPV